MKKSLYIAVLLFLPAFVWCQDGDFVFYPLSVFEEVSDINELKSIEKADNLNKKDFFFTENYKNNRGLFLIKKENDKWVVYQFDLEFGSNSYVKNIKVENNHFVSIQYNRSPSGGCSSLYGMMILLDITRNEFISFFNLNEFDCYDGGVGKCKANFSIKGNILQIKSTKKRDDGLECIESGTYQYETGKFIRKK